MFNIVDAIETQVTPVQVERMAAFTGEPPAKARQTMSSAILAILACVMERTATPEGATTVLGTLRAQAGDLWAGLLGDRGGLVTQALARSSGLTVAAATGVIGALLPMVVAVLGREVYSRNLDARALGDLLRSPLQPAPLQPAPDARAQALPFAGRAPVVQKPRRRRTWLPLALALGLVAVALGLVFLDRQGRLPVGFVSQRAEQPQVEAPLVEEVHPEEPSIVPAPPLEPAGETTLTGAVITTEQDLATHFAAATVPDRMALEGLAFDGSGEALIAGEQVVDRIATLMKEHPSARLRIEGHTDEPGDPEANAELSMKRATVVRDALIEKGVDGARIEAIGRVDDGGSRIEAVITER